MDAAYRLLTTRESIEKNIPDILENTNYWGKVCAGCLIMANDTGRFLMPLRGPGVTDPNCWGTWGGGVDNGEHIEAAVRREVMEEAGYEGGSVMYPLYVFRGENMIYYNYLMVVPHEFDPVLNWETTKAIWFDTPERAEPKHPGLHALLNDDPSIKTIQTIKGKTPSSRGLFTD